MGVSLSYVWELVFFTLGGKGFLRLGVSHYYVWGLVILTFGG